ncbi:hypothetical protein Bbelb_143560 [Branchiostoma belcheri]|nr:hypothetical protein Bbelb_143560 [Branchiostoma belcheri]
MGKIIVSISIGLDEAMPGYGNGDGHRPTLGQEHGRPPSSSDEAMPWNGTGQLQEQWGYTINLYHAAELLLRSSEWNDVGAGNGNSNVQPSARLMVEISYEDRLRRLQLPTLEHRRKRGDVIQVFKFVKGFDRVDPGRLFNLNVDGRTRGHPYKIAKPQAKKLTRSNSFSVRAINAWNSLPADVVAADTVNSFKSRLDSYWRGTEYT